MAQLSRTQLVGDLTKGELLAVLPANTFTKTGQCMTWSYILEVLGAQSNEILSIVQRAKEEKEAKLRQKRTHKQQEKRRYRRQNEGGSMEGGDDVNVEEALREGSVEENRVSGDVSETSLRNKYAKYLELPTEAEVKDCFRAFREATSNAALVMEVCVVCAREFAHSEGTEDEC
jgi:hypothetical protein